MKEYLIPIKRYFSLCRRQTLWRKRNAHNFTTIQTFFPLERVSVGKYTYGSLNIYSYRNSQESLSIGSFCSIASDVLFLLSGEHNYSYMSSYPFIEKIFHEEMSSVSKGPIIVEDDVWIGVRCIILSGVTIGQGSIIGANSVVTKDVPPYSIFVGNKVIKFRFPSEIIQMLLQIDFSIFSQKDIDTYHNYMKTPITLENYKEILANFID